jgi:uncharacterized membrane protein
MIDESSMYWLTRLDHIHNALLLVNFVCFIALIATSVVGCVMKSVPSAPGDIDVGKYLHKYVALPSLVFFVIFGSLTVFIPTTKEMVAIKVIPAIANNTDLQGVGQDMVVLAKEWLNELRPKSDKPDVEKKN